MNYTSSLGKLNDVLSQIPRRTGVRFQASFRASAEKVRTGGSVPISKIEGIILFCCDCGYATANIGDMTYHQLFYKHKFSRRVLRFLDKLITGYFKSH